MTKNPSSDATLPKGIHRSWKLPDKSLGDLWDSIVMDEAIKKQLLTSHRPSTVPSYLVATW